jgi:hypothetical protein
MMMPAESEKDKSSRIMPNHLSRILIIKTAVSRILPGVRRKSERTGRVEMIIAQETAVFNWKTRGWRLLHDFTEHRPTAILKGGEVYRVKNKPQEDT